ncbi:MAG TPA: YciI family protein [Thermoanaerobaculia bacterium]
MLYSILCYDSEDSVCALSQAEDDALMAKLMDVTRHLEDQGRLGPRLRLMPTTAATTLKANGEVIDGPYAETKEALLGFYILDCESLEEAVEITRKLARQKSWDAGSYEIRPVRWIDAGTLPG